MTRYFLVKNQKIVQFFAKLNKEDKLLDYYMRLIIQTFILAILSVNLAMAKVTTWYPEMKNLISQALSSQDKEDLVQTIDFHKAILKRQPNNLYSINSIAEIYGKLGQYNNQVLWAMKAIAIDGNDDLAYVNYGNGLLGLGKITEAENAYDRALKIDANSSKAIYSLGLIADQKNDYLTAIDFYKKSLELDPFFENSYFKLAIDYANLQKYDEAIGILNLLLNLNPHANNAKRMLADFEQKKMLRVAR